MKNKLKIHSNVIPKFIFSVILISCFVIPSMMFEPQRSKETRTNKISTTDFLPGDYMTNLSYQDWPNTFITSKVTYPVSQALGVKTLESPIEVSSTKPVLETNLTLSSIYLDNVTTAIETFSYEALASSSLENTMYFQEFKVPSNCFISNVSFFLQTLVDTVTSCTVSFYTAKAGIDNTAMIGSLVTGLSKTFDPSKEGTTTPKQAHWETITGLPRVMLDVSNTASIGGFYRFFAAITMPKETGYYWFNCPDGQGDKTDNGAAYKAKWQANAPRAITSRLTIDFTMIVGLEPESSIPLPSSIVMQVDGEEVQDIAPGTGVYLSNEVRQPEDGKIMYTVTCTWGRLNPKAVTFSAVLHSRLQEEIPVEINNTVDQQGKKVYWEVNLGIDTSIEPNASILEIAFPRSWTNITLFNTTAGTISPHPFSLGLEITGKKQLLTVQDITQGTWRMKGSSLLLEIPLEIDTIEGYVNIQGMLRGNANVPTGPNGHPVTLWSDLEGDIASAVAIEGTSLVPALHYLSVDDGKVIKFWNDSSSASNLLPNGFLVHNYINASFGIQLFTPEGFKPENIQDIELVVDHDGFDSSWFKGNVSGIDVPTYPAWNIDGFTVADWQKLMQYNDGQAVRVQLEYSGAPDFSDVYFNMTATHDMMETVTVENVTSISLDFAWNMSWSDSSHQLYVKNQTDQEWVLMTTASTFPGYGNDSIVHWESYVEGITNLYHIMKNDGNNTVEFYIRATDTSEAIPVGIYDFNVDMIFLNVSYTDTFDNFSIQVYDWNKDGFIGDGITVVPSSSNMIQTKLNLSSYISNLNGMVDATRDIINISIRANAITPIENTVTWDVDRIKVNVIYTDFQRLYWNETVSNENYTSLYQSQAQTLFNAPTNNFTINHPVASIATDLGEYLYQMIWSNMSDMGINYSTYKLTPLQLAMNPIQGAYIDGMSGEWFLDNNNKPYPNDVSKSIILIIKDTFFGTPVSGATIEIAWMGISGPSITWVDRYYEHGNDPEYLGQYEVHLNTTGLNVTSATSYRMQLNATKAYYLGVETILNLEILPLPLAIIPSSFSPTVFENESTTISVSIIESFNQLQITTANVRWHIKERPSINGTMEHVLMGVYQGIIDLHAEDTFLASGNYTLVYNVTTSITEQRTLELPLKVIGKTSVNIEFSRVPGSTSLGAGTFETFEFILSTMDGTPMQGKKLTITFTVTLRSGIGDITRFNRETDGNGIASLSVQLPETWRSFTVEVSFDGSGTTYATESVSHPDTFRVNTEVERVMLAIESSWIPIVACIAALVVLLAVRMRQVRKRRHEWSKDAEEIRDITKIKHILIIDKISGMMLLQRSYSQQKLEGALVSGFLSAITSFGDEVGYHVRDRKKDSEDTMFFDYKDFKIILIEGKNVKAAMFLGDTPTEHLREHLRSFIVKFEEKYNVENWNGDMSLFNDVDNLIESCCEITIIYPLVMNENANKSKVRSRLGRSLLKAAEATQSISQVFYLSTLVKYGTAYRNESPLQVLSEIYRLKREGFFIPYKGPDNTLS